MLTKFLVATLFIISVCTPSAFADDQEEGRVGAPPTIHLGEQDRPRFDIGLGYVHSSWSRIGSNLKNGSLAFRVGASREFAPSIEGGWNLTLLNGTDNSQNGDNISAITFGVGAKWLLMPGRISPFAGLGVDFGGFRAWSLESETTSQITYAKHASGVLVGVTPSLGVRMVLSPRTSVEIAANYLGYFDNPANKVGGWAALVSFSFSSFSHR